MIIKSVYVKGAHLREIEAVRSSFNFNLMSLLYTHFTLYDISVVIILSFLST